MPAEAAGTKVGWAKPPFRGMLAKALPGYEKTHVV
jgi:hypothetical protein